MLSLWFVRLVLVVAPAHAVANPDGIAVIIGNKGYAEGIPAVDFALNDADAMRRFVVDVLGYDPENVIDLRDATQAELVSVFGNAENHKGKLWSYLAPDGVSDVVVFYSGHGVPGLEDKRGYLLPVDADPNQPELNGYPLDLLYRNLGKLEAEAGTVTVYLDTCFSGSSGGGRVVTGTSGIDVPYKQPQDVGALRILTAAEGDQVASWDRQAKHGLFTRHLLDALHGKADAARYGTLDGKVTLAEAKAYLDRHMTRAARRQHRRVQRATARGSDDAVLTDLPKDTALQVASLSPPKPKVKLEPVEAAYVAIKNANVRAEPTVSSAKVTRLATGTEVYVPGKTSDGKWLRVERDDKGLGYIYAPLLQEKEAWEMAKREAEARRKAEAERRRLAAATAPKPSGGTAAKSAVGTYERSYKPGDIFKDCDECPEMVVVPAGSFTMGSPSSERGRQRDEGPQHLVTIPKSFAVGKFEIMFDEWDACVAGGDCNGYRPGYVSWSRARQAVINVSWEDAKAYVAWLSRKTGRAYRLLSESEFEYAARGRTTTRYHWGDAYEWQKVADGVWGTEPVGRYPANAFGLYDIIGNVWEWTEDCWNKSYSGAPSDGGAWTSDDCDRRVLRGGSSWYDPKVLRSAARSGNYSDLRDITIGFRVARTL